MRFVLFACIAACLFSCNSSSESKDPNKAKDDTARMDNPPAPVITPVKMTAADIPSAIKIKGRFREGWKWTDALGENLFFTSFIAPRDHKDEYGEDVQTAELGMYHYIKGGDGEYKERWRIYDGVRDCIFDITCEFIEGATTVTDLDKDGIAETKVQYATACRSDVSPAYMRLVLHEDSVKYSLEGNRWLAHSPEMKYDVTAENVNLEKLPKSKDEMEQLEKSFGRYENEKDFLHAPPSFLDFARTEWLKYSKEKMGE